MRLSRLFSPRKMDCYFPGKLALVQGFTRLAGHRHPPQARSLYSTYSLCEIGTRRMRLETLCYFLDSRLVGGVFDPSSSPTSFGPFLASPDRIDRPTAAGMEAQDTSDETGMLRPFL